MMIKTAEFWYKRLPSKVTPLDSSKQVRLGGAIRQKLSGEGKENIDQRSKRNAEYV